MDTFNINIAIEFLKIGHYVRDYKTDTVFTFVNDKVISKLFNSEKWEDLGDIESFEIKNGEKVFEEVYSSRECAFGFTNIKR